MSDRQDFGDLRTDRPERESGDLLTVADVLAMSAVQAGAPEVIVGGAALDAGVRWAHVSDSPGVAGLLDGGELLLSTGAGWPTGRDELRAFALGLHRAGLAGIVVELGGPHERIPDAVVEACTDTGLALIALASEVKFVTITEAVHRALIAVQTDALRERQHLHEVFTALSLRGAPADVVVAETARALGAPVVLENLTHEVIAQEALRMPEAEVLAARSASTGLRVPVQARGGPLGHARRPAGAGASGGAPHGTGTGGRGARLRLPRRRRRRRRRVDPARPSGRHRRSARRALRRNGGHRRAP